MASVSNLLLYMKKLLYMKTFFITSGKNHAILPSRVFLGGNLDIQSKKQDEEICLPDTGFDHFCLNC